MGVPVEIITAVEGAYFTPVRAAAYYRVPRQLNTIVLHHWNDPSARPSFNGNLAYLLSAGVPSANDVIGYDEDSGRIRIINSVTYPNVAFTSGGAINAESVGLEIDPLIEVIGHEQRAGLIAAVAQRALDYCKIANKRLTLTAHRDYFHTACPGNMPFNEINTALDELWSEYVNPAPAQIPSTAVSTYTRIDKRVWLCDKEPTPLWDLGFTKYPDAKEVNKFSKGHPVDIVGKATHPLGSEYLMTAYSFGNADITGVPAHNTGFNRKDMVQAPEPQPVPTPTPTPEPVPIPMPTPLPDPEKPTPHDQQQDMEIGVIRGSINSLIALFKEIANLILSKLGKS